MQIVIDIPNSTFTDLKKKKNRTEVDVAVLNGTLLPKKLINGDKLIDSLKGIERLHIDDELRSNILNAVYGNIIEINKEKSKE